MAKPGGKSSSDNHGGLAQEIRKFHYYQKQLSRIINDTQRALKEIAHLNLIAFESSVINSVKLARECTQRPPAIVVLGTARARLVNFLLGEDFLPSHPDAASCPNGWRWLRLQYGPKKNIRLSFGKDIEIIEPKVLNFNWNKISSQNLSRNDNLDLSTVMDIEICNPFLENGVQILVPPDLGNISMYKRSTCLFKEESSIKDYETFFSQRSSFLENVFPIVLYALDNAEIPNTVTSLESAVVKDESTDCVSNEMLGMFNSLHLKKNKKAEKNDNSKSASSKFYIEFDVKNSESDSSTENETKDVLDLPSSSKKCQDNKNEFLDFSGLSEENLLDLRQIYELHPNVQVLFTLFHKKPEAEPETAAESSLEFLNPSLERQKLFLMKLVEQLESMSNSLMSSSLTGHWLIVDDGAKSDSPHKDTSNDVILFREDFIYNLATFIKGCLQKYILYHCNELSEIHNMILQQFILSSFDMAREMQIIPRKIQYVAEMEQQLYDALIETFSSGQKREELLTIMQRVLQETKTKIDSNHIMQFEISCHASSECINVKKPVSVFYSDISSEELSENSNPSIAHDDDLITDPALSDFDVIFANLNASNEMPQPFNTSWEERSIVEIINLPNGSGETSSGNSRRNSQVSFKQASLEIQKTVLAYISKDISIQLLKFVDCLRDSYHGTLQRCLESLEGDRQRIASEAVKKILFVTRTIDLQQYASFSFLHALIDQLRWFFRRLSFTVSGNRSCCVLSSRWRKQVAIDTVESLNPSKLAKIISFQLRERVRQSHEQFQSALHSLEEHHTSRLQQTEELKRIVRKRHAPCFARLCLESTSLADLVKYGIPRLAKEIGRGQYGVVYSVKAPWGGFEPCAVKSVIPPDERHFNELAMEFFHTRNIPEHDRIVHLRGSVIDYSYEGGNPAVLLISERMRWDLHCALMHGKLPFKQRMQIAIDIVEGIRYLHSQGLVHRDVKLQNVLLDESNRAKLTDLGFCIPEAMMSGSIVGTPVHMAPELHSGIYDNSVDVYAFGILFWYVCVGQVRLPAVFEHFQNKEQLWTNVKKGLRPERRPQFSDACWLLMERCWAADPAQRPLLGDVQPILEKTRDDTQNEVESKSTV